VAARLGTAVPLRTATSISLGFVAAAAFVGSVQDRVADAAGDQHDKEEDPDQDAGVGEPAAQRGGALADPLAAGQFR
jgi:hypothetical protein